MKTLLRILIFVVLVALGILLILFVASRLGGFGTIGNLVYHLGDQLGLMWQRITGKA